MTDVVTPTLMPEVTPTTTVTPAPAVSAEPTTVKLKVNGKEMDVSIDELKRSYGLHKTAYTKLEEAAKIRKEAEELKTNLSQKDLKSLIAAGWTEDELEQQGADFLVRRAKEKSMTSEQRAQYNREQEYLKLKKEADDRALTEKQQAQQSIEAREAQLYQTAFFADVEKAKQTTWLDLNDPIILAHVINDITSAITKYNYDMPVSEAVKRQEDRLDKKGKIEEKYLRKLLKSSIPNIDDTDLDALIKNGVKGLRDNSVAAIKKSEAPFAKQKSQVQSSTSTPTKDQSIVRDANYYRGVKFGQIDPITGKSLK